MTYDFPTLESAHFPLMVVVSLTNVCHYRCAHCFYPTYTKHPSFKRHDIEFNVFQKIAIEIGQYPHSNLRILAWGEPLFHPRIVDFVQLARNVMPRNKITLITNGQLLTSALSLALMNAGLDLIEISIDAATVDTYRKVRVSIDPSAFSVVKKNVEKMVNQRNLLNLDTKIVVSFIVWPNDESEEEFKLFQEKWSGKVDDVVKRPLHTFKGINQTRPLPQPRQPCYGLWARCNINPYGQIAVCYNDWERENILGDLNDPKLSIADVWQGHHLTKLRADQRQSVFHGCCSDCRDYNPYAWENPYEKVINRCFSKK